MNKPEVELKVGELTQREEFGRGIVRIDSKTMQKIGIKEGDVVEIEGTRKTAAIAVRAYPADAGLNVVRMDGLVRRNAGAGVGDTVKIRKAEVKDAKRVTLAPAQEGVVIQVSPNIVKQNIYYRPVMRGDIIVPSPIVKRRDVDETPTIFRDFFGFDFEDFFFTPTGETRFVVTSTDPAGIVRITEGTQLQILRKLPRGFTLEKRAVPAVTYEDIGGIHEAIQKVREMIELPLRHPELFTRLGIEPPKGVLLYGPPGCGKTLLAKAVANESGANFYSINGPEIMCISGDTPLILDNRIVTIKKIFRERKGKLLGNGSDHISFSTQGKTIGITNPSFTIVNTPLTEITRVEVPFFFKLSTDNHSYELSSNHPVFVLSSHGIAWKTAPSLDISSDYIITSIIETLEPPEIEFRSKKINSPTQFSNELSYLVGLIAGDGHVGKDNLTFTGKDEGLHERFKSLLRRIFGINKFSTYKDKNENKRTVIYSTEIVRFFRAIGFKVGKKDYKEFLEKFLIRFDQRLLVAFLLGLLHTDGSQRKYSIVIYSSDRDALEKIRKISFSRGLNFKGPLEHSTKWSNVYKLVLRGRYNLLTFKHIADSIGFGRTLKISIPKRSYEYVPNSLMKIIKLIFLKHNIRYGSDWRNEPYINTRKKPTLATLERLLNRLKNYREKFDEKEKSFLNFMKKLARRKLMLDPVRKVERIDLKKTLYDIGTVTDNFITAYGHIMHNSKWYGQSEQNLRKIFEDAEKNAPSIIFIDEIDAIAPKREEVTGEVERRVVSQLLTLMDGLKSRGKVIVIAATNVPNMLDPALRRPGRFDREIEIGMPDRKGRKEILEIHTRHMPLAKDVSLDRLADITYGYTGADLNALCKEAAMHALRRLLPKIKWKEEETLPKEALEKLIVTKKDFDYALRIVEPSGMREVLIEVPHVKWSDVGGLEKVKEELKEIVEWPLKYPEGFKRLGIKPPSGVLLYGPPGCGKTLLAKAVASEAGANFISVRGPELLSKWFGESERRIRELFRRAKQVAPCIIFFDEIDAMVPMRGLARHEASERIVSQLLTELSGLEELKDVIVLGATNRPDMLDPALLRPGRLERQILVPPPDEETRLKILQIHTKNMPLKNVNLKKLAKLTENYSGADLEALCREAALTALRENKKTKEIKMKHFEKALKKVTPSLSEKLLEFYKRFEERFRKKVIEEEKPEKGPKYIG